jgi:hypothetical protein
MQNENKSFNVNDLITIEGISRKGKNRIKEGLGSQVIVINSIIGRITIAPINCPNWDSDHTRWIKTSDDPDFKIL